MDGSAINAVLKQKSMTLCTDAEEIIASVNVPNAADPKRTAIVPRATNFLFVKK